MIEFEVKSIADLPTVDQLWEGVCFIQAKSKTRQLEESDVKSGLFLSLCEAALRLCEKYGLEKSLIEVYEDGGAISNSYRNAAQSSGMYFRGTSIECDRFASRHVSGGDYGIRYCRIRVNATNPLRKTLKEEGWIIGNDQYARITEKTLTRIIPQPQSTDVVMGSCVAQPRPTDAVLGGKR